MTGASPTRATRTRRLATPAALFALALAIRALPFAAVIGSDRVYFVGMDAYYHMRRILYGVVRFPSLLEFDSYINYPDGGMPIWPPFFDTALSAVLLPFYALGGEDLLERSVVWIPPLLGASCVVALYGLAARHFDRSVALLAGLGLAVLSGHFWYSQIGFVDHHAAVALASTLLLAAAMAHVAPRPGASQRASAVLLGVACGATLLVWPGGLLHVAIIEIALLGFLVTRPARGDDETPTQAKAKQALSVLQSFVGDWRGVGQPKRGSTEGAWSEQSQWAWQFGDAAAAIVFAAPASKVFRDGRIVPGDKAGEYRLLATAPGEKTPHVYTGRLTSEDRLEFTAERPDNAAVATVSVRLVARGKRMLILYQKRLGGDRLTRLAEVGYTRKGSGFGKSGAVPECVVTGGAALIPVTFKGKTYYVCCTGCRDYFNDHPEEVLAEYRARLAERKKDKE